MDEISLNVPGRIALTDGDTHILTYAEMNLRVASIAEALLEVRNENGHPNPRIAVLQEPGPDWVCSLLAILRIGGTYVALDLRSGLSRMAAIVQESSPSAIIVQDATTQHISYLQAPDARIVNVSVLLKASSVHVLILAHPDMTAMVLFTSGSTGIPKGISLSHRALQSQMEGSIATWQYKSETVLQQSAYSFDLSVWQIYIPLLSGGTCVVAPRAVRNDPTLLSDLIFKEGVTITGAVPSEYSTWFRFGDAQKLRKSQWSTMVAGGEQFSIALVQELRNLGKPNLRAVNIYGPTETTIAATGKQSTIKKLYSVDLPLVQLFELNSLEKMAAAIEQKNLVADLPAIDWEVETELDFRLLELRASAKKDLTHTSRGHTVILTGSTGFLGKEILRQLVLHDTVKQIYCIALRSPTGQRSDKIEEFRGDLRYPLLGLKQEDAQRIFSDANILIHNGADVSFLKTYHSLKTTNVNATKELARLVLKYGSGTQFHYVSTVGVSQLIDGEVLEQTSVAGSRPPSDGSNGYVASKWASERFLEKTNNETGLGVVIHRPSSIYGEKAPTSDVMQSFFRYSRELKAVPGLQFWSGYIDLIGVEKVALGILSYATDEGLKQDPRYVHHSGEIEIPVSGLKDFLERESNSQFETLSQKEWIDRARALGLSELVASYMLSLNGGTGLVFRRVGR